MPCVHFNNNNDHYYKKKTVSPARPLTDKELLAKESRVPTTWNKVKKFFGFGEQLTEQELQRLQKLHATETKAASAQQASTNKIDQSIWTIKDKKK